MAEKRMLELLDRLLAVVDQLEWKYDAATDGYWVRTSPNVVEIRSMDRDGHHPFGLIILAAQDEIVESLISNEDIDGEYVEKLERLYLQAKRAEKNLSGVLDNILSQLPEP
jgi:hypothetical protein